MENIKHYQQNNVFKTLYKSEVINTYIIKYRLKYSLKTYLNLLNQLSHNLE